MRYKVLANLNIAVIGTGKASKLFVEKLYEAGHNLFVAGMNDKEEKLLPDMFIYDDICVCSIEEAAQAVDIIIIATHPSHVREAAYRLDDVRGKVVIDATDILEDKEESNIHTLNAIKAITGSSHVAKYYNCKQHSNSMLLSYGSSSIDIFTAGQSKKAKETVKLLTKELGYADCYDFGGHEGLPVLEDMARYMMSFAGHIASIEMQFQEK